MTHEELIAKARAHMKPFDRRNSFGVSADVFNQARVVETAVVYLGSQERDDYIEVYLNRETGEFITATYHPGASRPGGRGATSEVP
jgi:hypothetical protein